MDTVGGGEEEMELWEDSPNPSSIILLPQVGICFVIETQTETLTRTINSRCFRRLVGEFGAFPSHFKKVNKLGR